MDFGQWRKQIKGLFKSEDSKFRIAVASKITAVPVAVSFLVIYLFWVIMKMNNIFFEANGLMSKAEVRTAFTDYIINDLMPMFPYLGLGLIILFFVGIRVAGMLLRPFKEVGEYCERSIENPSLSYAPDMFNGLQLLTRFGELFFNYVSVCRKDKKLEKNVIPPQYAHIHSPVFEKSFFIQFSLLVVIISGVAAIMLYMMIVEMHSSIIQLALDVLKSKGQSVEFYMAGQSVVLYSVITVSMSILVGLYACLAMGLFNQISGAAFGMFSTMRSFMKGNFSARVHFIGHGHIREYGRQLNKYLDHVEETLVRK